MITIRSPFCGYNTIQCAALYGEDLSCYSNKVESDSLTTCSYDYRLTSKAYLNGVTLTNISTGFLPTRWRQKSTGIDMEQNYVTVTRCIHCARFSFVLDVVWFCLRPSTSFRCQMLSGLLPNAVDLFDSRNIIPNTQFTPPDPTRPDSTKLSRRVGSGGVNWV